MLDGLRSPKHPLDSKTKGLRPDVPKRPNLDPIVGKTRDEESVKNCLRNSRLPHFRHQTNIQQYNNI
jgi:hypothetical protein